MTGPELSRELGDLLLQVLFYAQMAKEQGDFSIDDVLERLSDKLVRRHPHVFGDVKADTSSDVLSQLGIYQANRKRNYGRQEIQLWLEFRLPCQPCWKRIN